MQAFSIGPARIERIRQRAAACLSPWWRGVSSFPQRARTATGTLLRALTIGRYLPGDRPLAECALENGRLAQVALALPIAASVATDERRRLAAQIHHGLAQHMANALMQLQLCERYLVADPARGREFLHHALRFAQVAMDATRATIYELQYPSKQIPRISAVLHATAGRLGSLATADISVDVDDMGPLSPAMESGLCAIACEALTNAVKHAAAEHIAIRLRRSQDTIVLEVSDDGIGFDLNAARADIGGGFGLKLMRDQAERLGGVLQIERRSSGGTLASVVVRLVPRSSVPRQRPDVSQPDRASGA